MTDQLSAIESRLSNIESRLESIENVLRDWPKIERILIRFDREQRPISRRPEWKTAVEFRTATGKTEEQMRGIRERHPELCKAKPGPNVQGRYLYDIAGYDRIYNA